ncbi:MAG: type II toxin-antitoxin system Phd/YefM family antitoxin [Actinomycetota bacterium]|nr:type II toxin-antitoxin system Phd/YefM family antitoxin [Actinomycetota bacterium]
MSNTISVSEARAALADILERVVAGEEVTITRHGKAVAVVVRPDALTVRRADEALAAAQRLRDVLGRGGASQLSPSGRLTSRQGELLVADVRAGHSAR